MIRLKWRSTPWLAVIGSMITVALVAANIPAALQIALISIFAAATAASIIDDGGQTRRLIRGLARRSSHFRASSEAREATDRARSLGAIANPDIQLVDIGLIALQSSHEGMSMRRARSVSRDDDGVRPFITLHVSGYEAERSASIRFEVINQHGEEQFVHEMRTYLRAGEMNILSDHHLPLASNNRIQGSGDWDLHVYINDELAGLHSFMLAPSVADQRQRLSGRSAMPSRREAQSAPPLPVSLRDLIESSDQDRDAGPAASKSRSDRQPK